MLRRIIPDVVQNQEIWDLKENDTVLAAAKHMAERNIAAVCITDAGGKLVGIATERDMTRRVLAKAEDPEKVTLSDIMTRDPDTLSPGDTAGSALELMRVRKFRHLPVVDDDNKVIGMVSIRDLYAAVQQDLEEDVRETKEYVFGDRYSA